MVLKFRGLARSRDKLKTSTIIMLMATKVGRVVTLHEEFPPIMSHDPSVT